MLDTIKINTKNLQIIKPIFVQDIYGQAYQVEALRYPEMGIKEKRFVNSASLIEKTRTYYPSVTFRSNHKVYIEFSAPKILYDNNIEELDDSDKDAFLKTLGNKLYDMGLAISAQNLWESSVSFATVSKNVIINDDIGASEFIEFTRRLHWKWRHSTKLENYEENGISIRKFSSSTGIGIYAKIPSLRNIITKTDRELELSEGLRQNNILRFEYRMQKYQRTKSKYSWAKGFKLDEVKLKDIFNNRYSKRILLYDLDKSLFSDEFKLLSIQMPTIRKMYDFLMNQGLKPREELAVIACFRLCSDLGVNTTKEIFKARYSESTSKRVFRLCEKVFKKFESYEYSTIREYLQKEINDFLPIKRDKIDDLLKASNEIGLQGELF